MYRGMQRRDDNGQLTPIGLAMVSIPPSIVVMIVLWKVCIEHLTTKPSDRDLVGTYHIVKVTVPEFDEATFQRYKLQFYENGTFSLTPTPHISVCESGTYEVDYDFDLNELTFGCHGGFTTAHIDRGFGSFRIEFIVGDPDSEESIYFEKDENE